MKLNLINRFDPLWKGAVSYFYQTLLERTPKDSSAHRQAWASELNDRRGVLGTMSGKYK